MDKKIKIVCPSSRRSGEILTDISNMIFCIDKKEKNTYREKNPNIEIITHPGLKNLSEIRQFIYEKFGDVFMVDDDIIEVRRLYVTDIMKLTPDESYKLIQKTYNMAKDIGAYLFGFNCAPKPLHFNQHKPFLLNGFINGCAIGLLKNKNLYFDKHTVACESHWITLLNAYYNRFCFIDKRFCFTQEASSTFLKPGGQTGKRTLATEKADTLFLQKKFGSSVKITNKVNKLHKYQRKVNIRL